MLRPASCLPEPHSPWRRRQRGGRSRSLAPLPGPHLHSSSPTARGQETWAHAGRYALIRKCGRALGESWWQQHFAHTFSSIKYVSGKTRTRRGSICWRAGTHLHHGDVEAVHRAQGPAVLQLLGRLRIQLHLLLLLCGRDAEEVLRQLPDVHLRAGESARPARQDRTPISRTQTLGLPWASVLPLGSGIQPGDPATGPSAALGREPWPSVGTGHTSSMKGTVLPAMRYRLERAC